jgi:hypothetical protein
MARGGKVRRIVPSILFIAVLVTGAYALTATNTLHGRFRGRHHQRLLGDGGALQPGCNRPSRGGLVQLHHQPHPWGGLDVQDQAEQHGWHRDDWVVGLLARRHHGHVPRHRVRQLPTDERRRALGCGGRLVNNWRRAQVPGDEGPSEAALHRAPPSSCLRYAGYAGFAPFGPNRSFYVSRGGSKLPKSKETNRTSVERDEPDNHHGHRECKR